MTLKVTSCNSFLSHGLISCLIIVSGYSQSVYAYTAENIVNRLKPSNKLHVQGGRVKSSAIYPGAQAALWIRERVRGSRFIRLRSRYRTNFYLHIQRGRLQVGAINPQWKSAMWLLQRVPGTSYVRIQNRRQPYKYIHIEKGRVQASQIRPDWKSAMWTFKRIGGVGRSWSSVVRETRAGSRRTKKTTKLIVPVKPIPKGVHVEILQATYGSNCKVPVGNVTKKVQARCNGLVNCGYRVNPGVLGDPARGCRKDFLVIYRCGKGKPKKRAYLSPDASGKGIDLICFKN